MIDGTAWAARSSGINTTELRAAAVLLPKTESPYVARDAEGKSNLPASMTTCKAAALVSNPRLLEAGQLAFNKQDMGLEACRKDNKASIAELGRIM